MSRQHMSRVLRGISWGQGLGWGWLLLLVAAALLADYLPLPLFPDLLHGNAPPLSPGHLLGTDPQGQDVLSGLVYGARTALLVSVPAALLAALLGMLLGGAAGFWGNIGLRFPLAGWLAAAAAGGTYTLVAAPGLNPWGGGWWPGLLVVAATLATNALAKWPPLRRPVAVPADALIAAAMVALAALPRLLLVLVVAVAIEPGVSTLGLLLTLVSWPASARLMRAETRRALRLPYLEAARALGLPTSRLLFRHILPTSWPVVRTSLPMSVAVLISLETTLSFLGVGLPPEVLGWGRLLAASRLAPSSWWLILFPALALLLTALALRQLLPTTGARRT